MEIFPLIEQVLDELYEGIPVPDAEKDEEVNKSLAILSGQYGNLRVKSEPIDYFQPAIRFAYIYKYVTCHSNLVYTRILSSPALCKLFDGNSVRVACLGGGPGSDFLGILKYCIERHKNPELKCDLFDREAAWGESWSDVDDKISTEDKLHTRTVYQPVDVTKPATYEWRAKYLKQSDLFTMIYFVSEVYGLMDDGADDYFNHLLGGMRSDALVLYVDNNHSDFTSWIEGKFETRKLKIIAHGEGRETLPTDEEKRHLGKYYDKFNSQPKLEADIAWRIARKR